MADPPADTYRAPLLLHSLAEFREVAVACLDVVEPVAIAEIGAEEGFFTRVLLDWAAPRDAAVYAVNPQPGPALTSLTVERPELRLVEAKSIDALPDLGGVGVFFVDGDHNYFTVSNELDLIGRGAGAEHPLVVLHDVGWPWGRRDLYYDPADVPPEHRQAFSWELGVAPGDDGLVETGFRGEGEFAVATRAGGAGNGVRSAVDDYLARNDGLAYAELPCIFGLGVVYPKRAPWTTKLRRLLAPYDGNPLLARLEANRIDLYVRLLEMQAELLRTHRERDEIELGRRDALTENRALWFRIHELQVALDAERTRSDGFRRELESLVASRPFLAAELVARLRTLTGGKTTLSRQHLRQVLDES
jgi:hypothetical protein